MKYSKTALSHADLLARWQAKGLQIPDSAAALRALTFVGYFRLRGDVDVLGLISAAIELYMELVYEFHTGKMLGRATITVEVEVLFFSGSVSISAERRFAGSNGDPSLREIVMESDGRAPAWDTYLEAFASEVAA